MNPKNPNQLLIPLRYFNEQFASAVIDQDPVREQVLMLGNFSVTLPKRLRNISQGRQDVILALLRNQPELAHQCYPFITIANVQVKLVHLVLRPELINVCYQGRLAEQSNLPNTLQGGLLFRDQVNEVRRTIGRVVHANGNKLDCTLENLRELRTGDSGDSGD